MGEGCRSGKERACRPSWGSACQIILGGSLKTFCLLRFARGEDTAPFALAHITLTRLDVLIFAAAVTFYILGGIIISLAHYIWRCIVLLVMPVMMLACC
jgi:hypothetical protein